MAKTAELTVRVLDSAEFEDLRAQVHLALGDAQAWLTDSTPAWVRDEVSQAFERTRPRQEREHVVSDDMTCWCNPRIEHVPAGK